MTDIDPDDARDAADEILSRSEFRERPQTLASRAIEWIFERLGEVLDAFFGGERGTFIGYIVVAVAIVAALYFLWRILPRRPSLARSGAPAQVLMTTDERLSRSDWLARAAEAEASGQWPQGVHARYHALTEGLADAAELPPELSKTSGEHRRHFADRNAGAPSRASRFEQATDRYEQVWFGGRNADHQDVAAVTASDEELLGPRS